MKTGRSLHELAKELTRQSENKVDFLIPANELGIQSYQHDSGSQSYLTGDKSFLINTLAHNQIADYLSIPVSYYDGLRRQIDTARVPVVDKERMARIVALEVREAEESGRSAMPSDDKLVQDMTEWGMTIPLFDVTVNTLFRSRGGDKRLVRTLDGSARALLSDQYNPDLDNEAVYFMTAAAIEMAGLSGENVISAEVTPKRLYIKCLCPKLSATVRPDNRYGHHGALREPQIIQCGFTVSSSEVGLGAVSVKLLLYKLACSNGFIVEESFKQRHIGRTLESSDNGTIYNSDTRIADAKARLLKLRDSITATLDEAKFFSIIGRIQETTSVKLEGGIEKVIEKTGQRFGLTIAERTDVFTSLVENSDLSIWGLSNAITAVAQTVKSYDRASELETIGGRLLMLPSHDIKDLATAVR